MKKRAVYRLTLKLYQDYKKLMLLSVSRTDVMKGAFRFDVEGKPECYRVVKILNGIQVQLPLNE